MQKKSLFRDIHETLKSFGGGILEGACKFLQGLIPGGYQNRQPRDRKNKIKEKIRAKIKHPSAVWDKITPDSPDSAKIRHLRNQQERDQIPEVCVVPEDENKRLGYRREN